MTIKPTSDSGASLCGDCIFNDSRQRASIYAICERSEDHEGEHMGQVQVYRHDAEGDPRTVLATVTWQISK